MGCVAVESKQGSCWYLLFWRISRKIRGVVLWTVGTPSVQGPWVSHYQGLEAGAWAGVEHALPWRASCPGACSSPQLWVPQYITEALGFCSTDVGLLRLGPTKHGRTSKEHMPQQWPFPASSCPAAQSHMCTQSLRPFWKRALFGVGQAGHKGAGCSPGTPLGSASLSMGMHPAGGR